MTKITFEAQQYIAAGKQGVPYYTLTAAEARAARANTSIVEQTEVELASIRNTTFTARDGEKIAVRIYTPKGKGPFPIIIYYHGGGWVFGNLESADGGCQLLASEAQAIVISVDYRLAPEYKFPIPLHDAYDALLWTYSQAASLNGLTNKISVSGDSAGGNLATVVTHIAKKENGPSILAQALIYPVTNVSTQSETYSLFGENYGLDAQAMTWFTEHYITQEEDVINPLISPLLADDVTDLPKTLIIAAEADVLLNEGVAYAQKLQQANVPTEYVVLPGLIHSYFSKMNFFADDTRATARKIAAFINK